VKPDDLRNDPELAELRALTDDVPALSAAARERAIRAALVPQQSEPADPRGLIQRFLFPAVAGAAAIAAIILFVATRSDRADGPDTVRAEPGRTVEVGDATVRAVDRWAELQVPPARDGIMLSAGRILVDVEPAPGQQFRVETPRFTAVVTGTRFEIDHREVEVIDGAVAIFAASGELLQPEVTTGQLWSVDGGLVAGRTRPARTVAEPAPAPAIEPRPEPVAEPPADSEARPQPRLSPPTWLRRARKALARGDTAGARTAVARALAGKPTRAQRAEGQTLLAEVSLVAGEPADALARYRAVARQYRGTAAGENALFAAARLAARTGDRTTAAALFRDYAARYPDGRFSREAADWLARLSN
jgi:hypothetical protein